MSLLAIVPRVGAAGCRAQIEDGGVDWHSVLLDAAADVASHAVGHRRVAVSGLKFVMDQRFLAADLHVDEAIGAMGFDSGLLGIDDSKHFEVVLREGEAGEIVGVRVDEMLGDGIKFGHGSPLRVRN